jgi:hypothetical protein
MDNLGYYSVVPPAFYKDGGFHDSQTVLDEMRPITRDLGQFEVVTDQDTYKRPLPTMSGSAEFMSEIKSYFEQINKSYHHQVPVVIGTISDALIFHNTILLGCGEGLGIVYETLRPCDRPSTPDLHLDALGSLARDELPEIDGIYCYLGSPGYFNYGHWLVDDLSRALLAVDRLGRNIHWLIPSHRAAIDQAKQDSLDAVTGSRATITFVKPDRLLRVRHLVYVSPTSYHPFLKSSVALRRLRSLLARDAGAKDRRLFVVRGEASTRRLLNERAIADILRPLGYETIEPGRMSFDDQRRAFASASHVIGTMGAEMTNTIFCQADANILYLSPDRWIEPFFWDLAAAMGHTYGCIFGTSDQSHGLEHLRNFAIDIPTLSEAIRSL